MKHLRAQDLLPLLSGLSQMPDRDRLAQAFSQELNRLLGQDCLSFAAEPAAGDAGPAQAIPVATAGHQYGWLRLAQGHVLDQESLALLAHAAGFLALLLENRELGFRREAEKTRLDLLVGQRTEELREANQQFCREVAGRTQAQEALAASEKQQRAILQTAMDGYWLADVGGRLLEVNETYCRMSGYTRRELLALNITDLDDAHSSTEILARMQNIVANREGRFETRHQRKDGSLFDVEVSVQYRPAEAGLLVAFLRDITARKRAEQVEKANLLQQRLAMDMAGLVHWEYNATADLFTFNDQFYALYATTAAREGGYHLSSEQYARRFLSPEDAPLVREEVAEALATNDPNYFRQLEHRIIRADGEERLIVVRFAVVKDEAGRTIRTYGANQDITERRRASQERREKDKRARAVFEQAAVGMSILTPAGEWLEVNQRLCDILGYPRDELLRLSYRDISHPDHVESDIARVRAMVQGAGDHASWEKRYIRADGQVIWVRLTTSLARGEDGRPKYFITVTEDITEAKRAEGERAAMEAQLRQAQKMEAIGTLAGGIAHDFNNILGAILGFAEMVHDDAQAGQVNSRDLEQIMISALRAKELVRQILAFSRKDEPDLKPLSLNQVVRRSLAILQRTLPKMISLEADLADGLPPLLADPTQMEQVLFNLAANGRDAMPEGGRLTFATREVFLDEEYCRQHLEAQPGRYLLLAVADSGVGMDQGTQEHIFEPFFTTKEVGKGTGLGLSSVYGIVKNHGGQIHCYSDVGQGTTIQIYLPVFRQGWRGETRNEDRLPVAGARGQECILLVDDEENLRDIGVRALESKGYKVATAASGEEALALFRRPGRRLDLVIMDLGLPGMGGHKALEAMREIDPGVKVIIASGYAMEGQAAGPPGAGAAGYVAKPFRLAELLITVRNVLDRG
ncbi:MAG: PAS domain S-box protein [Deltaproteobacteria bacterium]|nr:PAS domain S-box protein [Deltaproteobacteria bacterium]